MTNSYIDRNRTSRHYHDADEKGIIDAHNYNGILDDRLWQSDSALLVECKIHAASTPCVPPPPWESNGEDTMIDEMIAGDRAEVQEPMARFQGTEGKPSSSVELSQSDSALLEESKSDAAWTPCLPAPSWDSNKVDADEMIADEMIAHNQPPKVQELVACFEGRSSESRSGGRSSSVGPAERPDSPSNEIRRRRSRSHSACRFPTGSTFPKTSRGELLQLRRPSSASMTSTSSTDSDNILHRTTPIFSEQLRKLGNTMRGELLQLRRQSLMTSTSSASSKSSASPNQIRSSTEDEADVSTSNNVAAEANSGVGYKIGQDLLLSSLTSAPSRSSKSSAEDEANTSISNNVAAKANSRICYETGQALLDSSHSVPFRSSSEASALLTKLQLKSPLFVRRTDGEWTLAVLAGRRTNRRGRTSLLVEIGKGDGRRKKVLRERRWVADLRLVDREIVSWVPHPAAGANASGRLAESAAGPAKTEKSRQISISRRLEAELLLYKMRNLYLTDQCRDLSERLAGIDSELEVAQARAPGAEPPRGFSTENTDGRLAALRALGKSTKAQGGENEKVGEERDLLKSKLEESERAEAGLEARLAADHAPGVLCAVDGAARAKEAEGSSSDETTKSVEELESEKQCLHDCLVIVTEKMENLQRDLDNALDSKRTAEAARDRAAAEAEASKSAEGAAVQEAQELRTLVDTIRNESVAAAADAKAREAEMKAEFENMQGDVNAVKSLLAEKDDVIGRLEAELRNAKEGAATENEAKSLQRVADRDNFDEDDSLVSEKSGRGLLQRWTGHAREKDGRIVELENSPSDDAPPSQAAGMSWSWRWPGSRRRVPVQDADQRLGGREREVLDQAGGARVEVQRDPRVGGVQRVQEEQCDNLEMDHEEEYSVCSQGTYSVCSQGTSLTWGSSMTGASKARPDEDQECRNSYRAAADPTQRKSAAGPRIHAQEEPLTPSKHLDEFRAKMAQLRQVQELEVLDEAGGARVEKKAGGWEGFDRTKQNDDEEYSVRSQGTSLAWASSLTAASKARLEEDQELRNSDLVASDPELLDVAIL